MGSLLKAGVTRRARERLGGLSEEGHVGLWNVILKGGGRLLRRPADGFDECKRGPSCSCGHGMRRRHAKLLSDAQSPRQRHQPTASLCGQGHGGGGGQEGGNGESREGGSRKGAGRRRAQETDVLVWPSSS